MEMTVLVRVDKFTRGLAVKTLVSISRVERSSNLGSGSLPVLGAPIFAISSVLVTNVAVFSSSSLQPQTLVVSGVSVGQSVR